MKRILITALISYLISNISYLSLAASPLLPFELPPFVFAGRIVDYAHIGYDSESAVEIRVKTTDGTLLAKTTTRTGGDTEYNYAIEIPLSSSSVSGCVTNGTEVVFEFVDPYGFVYSGLVLGETARIGVPGGMRRVDVMLATDDDGDGIPDEYLETLEYLMWIYGIEEFDPNADYDGDGQSNYDEYMAGTDPFDATDKFSVQELAMTKGKEDYIAFRFQVNQGRYYSVDTTRELGKPAWTGTPFSVADPSAALQSGFTTGPSETGYRTIFLKKGTDPSRFWKLKVE